MREFTEAVEYCLNSSFSIAALGRLCERLRIHRAWPVGLPARMSRWPILTSIITTAALGILQRRGLDG